MSAPKPGKSWTLHNIGRLIKFGGLYLETGFLDLISYARCAEGSYKPAELHYNPALTGYMTGAPNVFQGKINTPSTAAGVIGETIAEGAESAAVGCKDKLATVNALYPCVNVYTSGGYCEPQDIFAKKLAQGTVPASKFSGKLRLYIQAIYGAKRKDYRMLTDPSTGAVLDPESLIIGAVQYVDGVKTETELTISTQFASAWGLFTTADYDYYLVNIGSTVKYYPLLITSQASKLKPLLTSLSTSSADKTRIEAYILSTSKPDITPANIKTSGSIATVGQPLYYGWHFKLDGSEANIVCHEGDNTNMRYNARKYKLDISYSSGTFTHNLTLEANNYWWVVNTGHIVYKPNPVLFKMEALPMVADGSGSYSGNPNLGSFNAVIHVFRNSDDVLISVTAINATSTRPSSSQELYSNTTNPLPEMKGSWADTLLTTRYKRWSSGARTGSRSLSVGAETLSVDYDVLTEELEVWSSPAGDTADGTYAGDTGNTSAWPVYPGPVTVQTYLLSTGLFHSYGAGQAVTNTVGSAFTYNYNGTDYYPCYNCYVFSFVKESRTYTRTLKLTVSKSGSLLTIIPFNDCSAVFYGKKQTNSYSKKDNNSAISSQSSRTKIDFYNAIYIPALYKYVKLGFLQEGNYGYTGPLAGIFIPANVTSGQSDDTYSYKAAIGNTFVLVHSGPPSNSLYYNVDWFNYPFLDLTESAKTSVGGYWRYSSGYPDTGIVNNTDGNYLHHSSIGWA